MSKDDVKDDDILDDPADTTEGDDKDDTVEGGEAADTLFGDEKDDLKPKKTDPPPKEKTEDPDKDFEDLEKEIDDVDTALGASGKIKRLFEKQNSIIKKQGQKLREVEPEVRITQQERKWLGFEQDANISDAPKELRDKLTRTQMGKIINREYQTLMDTGRYNSDTAHIVATDRAAQKIRDRIAQSKDDAPKKQTTSRPPGSRLLPPGGGRSAPRKNDKEVSAEEEFDSAIETLDGYDPSR